MFSEPALDFIALAFLIVTVLAWVRVFRSYRATPDDWDGSQREFEVRIERERLWTDIGLISLVLGCLVTFIDLVAN